MKIQLRSKSKTVFIIQAEDEIWGILPNKVLRFFSLNQDSFEIDDNQTEELKEEIEKYVWDKLLNYISFRERSVGECKNYLRLLPVHLNIAGRLIQKALELNFLNDERYAEIYVDDLIRKGKNKREITNKLYEKRISPQIIQHTITEFFTIEMQSEILEQNIIKALRRFARFSDKEKKEKCLNYLSRRGFSYSEVNEKINELMMKE